MGGVDIPYVSVTHILENRYSHPWRPVTYIQLNPHRHLSSLVLSPTISFLAKSNVGVVSIFWVRCSFGQPFKESPLPNNICMSGRNVRSMLKLATATILPKFDWKRILELEKGLGNHFCRPWCSIPWQVKPPSHFIFFDPMDFITTLSFFILYCVWISYWKYVFVHRKIPD